MEGVFVPLSPHINGLFEITPQTLPWSNFLKDLEFLVELQLISWSRVSEATPAWLNNMKRS